MARDSRVTGQEAGSGGDIRVGPLLAVFFCCAFMASFNENIVNVALVDIQGEFGIGEALSQWLVTGYMIVTTIVVTVVAFLQKRFTLRAIFYGGATILLVGSLAASAAPTFAVLLVARLLQSVGTGIFIPTMMATVMALAPRKRLGTYLSIGSCCITFGPAFGPVVSGLMVTFFGWRTIFLVPAAAMAVLMLAGVRVVRPIAPVEHVRMDLLSVALSAVGLTVFVYGLSTITSDIAVSLSCLAVGAVVIALFCRRQGRIETPLLNLEPLKSPRFSVACVLVVVSMMSTFSMSVLLPLYYQGALGTTALLAGVLVLVPILFNALTALFGGRIMDRFGEWPLLPCGFALIAVGMAASCLVAESFSVALMVAATSVVYAGVGFVMSPSQTAGLKGLPRELNGYGVALMSTFLQLSAAIGPGLYVGILSSRAAADLAAGATAALAQASGFTAAVTVAAGIGVFGFVVSFVYSWKVRGKAALAGAPEQEGPSLARVMKSDVYAVPASGTVEDAARLMLEYHTSGLPVVAGDGALVGFVSDGDIMKSLGRASSGLADLTYSLSVYADDEDFDARLSRLMTSNVLEIATENVVSIDAGSSIEDVCTLLGERRIKKLPVVEGGKIVGTISRNDVNRSLMAEFLKRGEEA